MGAYTHGTKSNFNGMETTTKVLIMKGEEEVYVPD